MCAITEWYRSVTNEDLPVGQAASKIMHKIEKLKAVGDGEALKQLAALPWQDQSVLARLSIVRGLWSTTRVPEFRPHFTDLRDRVHASLVNEFSQPRADFLLRGLYAPEFCIPFAEKDYALRETEEN